LFNQSILSDGFGVSVLFMTSGSKQKLEEEPEMKMETRKLALLTPNTLKTCVLELCLNRWYCSESIRRICMTAFRVPVWGTFQSEVFASSKVRRWKLTLHNRVHCIQFVAALGLKRPPGHCGHCGPSFLQDFGRFRTKRPFHRAQSSTSYTTTNSQHHNMTTTLQTHSTSPFCMGINHSPHYLAQHHRCSNYAPRGGFCHHHSAFADLVCDMLYKGTHDNESTCNGIRRCNEKTPHHNHVFCTEHQQEYEQRRTASKQSAIETPDKSRLVEEAVQVTDSYCSSDSDVSFESHDSECTMHVSSQQVVIVEKESGMSVLERLVRLGQTVSQMTVTVQSMQRDISSMVN